MPGAERPMVENLGVPLRQMGPGQPEGMARHEGLD